MSEHKAIVDHQGFLEAAKALDSATTVDLMNFAYHLEGTLSRGATLLRALDRILHSDDTALSVYRSDVIDLVALAQEAMEDPEEVFDQLDRLRIELQRAFKQSIDERKHLNKIIDAFATCGRPTTLDEVQRAAESVYEVATSNPAYAAHWETMRANMEAAGLVVTEAPLFPNGPLHAWVKFPEPEAEPPKAGRKAKRTSGKATASGGRAPA